MKIGVLLRIVALAVLGAILLAWAAVLSAADPAGDSPMNGIPMSASPSETCASQTLAPGAQVWLKVPYHAGKDLEMQVKNAAGVNFDVYDPSQVANWPTLPSQPIGRLTPNADQPGYTKTWQGHLIQSDFYYVLVTNTNSFPATFSFCTIETEKFIPPPGTGPAPSTTTDTCIITTSDTFFTSSEVVTTFTINTCTD